MRIVHLAITCLILVAACAVAEGQSVAGFCAECGVDNAGMNRVTINNGRNIITTPVSQAIWDGARAARLASTLDQLDTPEAVLVIQADVLAIHNSVPTQKAALWVRSRVEDNANETFVNIQSAVELNTPPSAPGNVWGLHIRPITNPQAAGGTIGLEVESANRSVVTGADQPDNWQWNSKYGAVLTNSGAAPSTTALFIEGCCGGPGYHHGIALHSGALTGAPGDTLFSVATFAGNPADTAWHLRIGQFGGTRWYARGGREAVRIDTEGGGLYLPLLAEANIRPRPLCVGSNGGVIACP